MPKAKAKTTSTPKANLKAVKKVIEKKAPVKKASPKKAIATKKQPVPPKQTAKSRTQHKSLDLCLILDCTGSMYSWI